jgi:hypothetical protein
MTISSERGLSYLATYDEAADLIDLEEPKGYYSGEKPAGTHGGVYWSKSELVSRMQEIIDS